MLNLARRNGSVATARAARRRFQGEILEVPASLSNRVSHCRETVPLGWNRHLDVSYAGLQFRQNRWLNTTASLPRGKNGTFVNSRRNRSRHNLPNDNSSLGASTGANIPRSYVEATEELVRKRKSRWGIEEWKTAEHTLKGWRQQSHVSASAVQLCWELLNRMVVETEQAQEQRPIHESQSKAKKVTTQHLNFALDYWRIASRYNNILCSSRWSASYILSVVDDYASRVPALSPDVKTYTMLLDVQTKQNPGLAPAFGQNLLRRIMTSEQHGLRPNAVFLTHLMDSYVKSGEEDAPYAVQQIFEFMVDQSSSGRTEMAPTEITLTKLLQSWILGGFDRRDKDGKYLESARNKIDGALEYMFQANTKVPGFLTSSNFLNVVLDSCVQVAGNKDRLGRNHQDCAIMAPLADFLIDRVREEAKINNPKLAPTGIAYNSIINLWSKSFLPNSPDMAERWLLRLSDACSESSGVTSPRPSLFRVVISAWESSGRSEAPYHGEKLWREMIATAHTDGGATSRSLAGGYHLLLSLWSKSKLPEGPQKAEELLKHMIDQHKLGTTSAVAPTCRDFVAVISSLGRNSHCDKAAPYKAQGVLELMLEEFGSNKNFAVNDAPFNSAIQSWARSGLPEAWSKVSKLLEVMKLESRRNPSIAPSIVTAWNALQCLVAVHEQKPKMDRSILHADINMKHIPNVADEATKLLNFIGNESTNTNKALKGHVFECVLRLLSEGGHSDAPYQALSILQNGVTKDPIELRRFDTTMSSYRHVLDCWTQNRHAPGASDKILELLHQMRQETDVFYENKNKYAGSSKPTMYMHTLSAWAHSGLSNSMEEASNILQVMLEQSKKVADFKAKIEGWCIIVVNGLAASGQPDKAEHFLRHIVPTLVPENAWKTWSDATDMYCILIDSWSKSDLAGAPERARGLLVEMIEGYTAGSSATKPSARVFAPVMTRYAQEQDGNMVDMLYSRLNDLRLSDKGEGDGSDFLPNKEILMALSSLGGGRVAREAAVLHQVIDRSRANLVSNEKHDLVDNETFASVLHSVAKNRSKSAGKLAENILLRQQELHEDGFKLERPNFETFQKVLDCWAETDTEGSLAAKRAEEILFLAEELFEGGDNELEPTFQGYMSVIDALSRSYEPDAPERIQGLLRKMKKRSEAGSEGFQLNGRTYVALARAYANSGRHNAAMLAQTVFDETPDRFRSTELYNSLILAQGGNSNRAESLLQEMHQLYLQGSELVKPDTESFNNCILSWSKSGSPMAAWRVDGIFQRMTELWNTGQLDVKPNGRTFDLVITTLSNDWGADAAAKVDRYLVLLKDLYESGETDCKPSVTTFTEAIRAWGSNVEDPRAVLRAKALLDQMHELAKNGVDTVKPSRHTYAVFLKALALSSMPDKDHVAREIATSMQENAVEPDASILSYLDQCYLPTR